MDNYINISSLIVICLMATEKIFTRFNLHNIRNINLKCSNCMDLKLERNASGINNPTEINKTINDIIDVTSIRNSLNLEPLKDIVVNRM